VGKVTLNRRGIGNVLLSRTVRDDLTDRAGRVLARAQALAPVATGAYKASLYIQQDTTDRAVVRVVAGVAYAMVVEANTGTLSRALDAARGS
jgi:Bacteriophage HK97-gp10, putative tail-component